MSKDEDEANHALLFNHYDDTQDEHSSPSLLLGSFSIDRETTIADSLDSLRSSQSIQGHDRKVTKRPRLMLCFLSLLYICEGIPSGLIGAALPVILKPALGFSRTGLFTICFYPFSLKLLWAPILDSVWLPRLGRRRTWLVLTLFFEGMVMLALAIVGRDAVSSITNGATGMFIELLILCFTINFLSATMGCATDGWVVAELPEQYQAIASATHEMGFMIGEFTANSAFLFLRDADFISLSQFCGIVGGLMLLLSTLLLLVPETATQILSTGPKEAYRSALKLFLLPPVRRLLCVLLLARLAFEVDDSATNLRLLEKGFTTSGIALITTVDLPTDILSSSLAAWFCRRYTPMTVWRAAFIGRLITTAISMVLVAACPEDTMPTSQIAFNAINRAFSISMRTLMFVAFLTFDLQVVDPVIGSVYMTLLGT